MNFKNKASPIFINSWQSLINNLNKIKIGDVLTLESKITNLRNVFIVNINKNLSQKIIELIIATRDGFYIKEITLTPNSF